MPGFAKSSPRMLARFEELADLVPSARRKPMFGYPSCTLNGNMFMSLYEDSLVLRLSDADRREFIAAYGEDVEFSPMPGRTMTSFVVVPGDAADGDEVHEWVLRSYRHAESMPDKSRPRSS